VIVDNAGRRYQLNRRGRRKPWPEGAFFHAMFARRGTGPLARTGATGRLDVSPEKTGLTASAKATASPPKPLAKVEGLRYDRLKRKRPAEAGRSVIPISARRYLPKTG
jgi:hypothetical protein